MRKSIYLLCMTLSCIIFTGRAQELNIDYTPLTTLKNSSGDDIGKGDQLRIGSTLAVPLSMKREENGFIKKWDLTLNGRYTRMNYDGEAKVIQPNEIISGGAMLTHVRSLSRRWNLVASLGVSFNAIPDHIRWQNISLSSGLIFMYSINKEFHIGIGAAMTTLYDVPIILPLPYIAWNKDGKYRIELNMRGVPELKISTDINDRTTISFKPFMMQRETAVLERKGKDHVYSMSSMGSTFLFQYKLSKRATWVANAGYIWRRTIKENERSWKGFWDSITDNENRCKFNNNFIFSTGIKFNLR